MPIILQDLPVLPVSKSSYQNGKSGGPDSADRMKLWMVKYHKLLEAIEAKVISFIDGNEEKEERINRER
jgi:hypothetical protein